MPLHIKIPPFNLVVAVEVSHFGFWMGGGVVWGALEGGAPVFFLPVFSQQTLSDLLASELVLISMENFLCVGRLVSHSDDAR